MKVRAVIMAGGEGSRLGVLTVKRTKPAVPFAGKYRIIDFTLSNCVNSNIFDVMILAQYRPHSLIEHIGSGGPWDLNRGFTGGVKIYSPFRARRSGDWYSGTADAVWQNLNFVKSTRPDLVLVLSGDHIYAMDYDPLIAFHLDHKADATLCTIQVPLEIASRFGILATDQDYRVVRFEEKPRDPQSNQVNMGVYLFNSAALEQLLRDDSRRRDSHHDFGKDILPRMVADKYRLFAFPYSGYWVDVGTLESYWQAHMDLLASPPSIDLNDRRWVIHTLSEERPPAVIRSDVLVRDSLLANGTIIDTGARVERSVLSPGVRVGKGAVVRESIIFTDTWIEEGAVIERAVVDKRVTIGARARVGETLPSLKDSLVTIGKNSKIPPEAILPAGVVIGTEVPAAKIPAKLRRQQAIVLENEED
ncbi:MAG: sugar phosphate nucleotidyltransferase [Chloroflexota bacterium]